MEGRHAEGAPQLRQLTTTKGLRGWSAGPVWRGRGRRGRRGKGGMGSAVSRTERSRGLQRCGHALLMHVEAALLDADMVSL